MLMRKSVQQRISDTEAAIREWSHAGHEGDRCLIFMRDCLLRLRADKGLSAKQRDWLDSLCAEGPPVPAGDPALISRIDSLKCHLDARGQSALDSLRFTIVSGRTLSENQEAFLNSLLSEAAKISECGRWVPSPEIKRKTDFAHSVLSSRGGSWKSTHPGTMGACERYDSWRKSPDSHHIDERTVEKILSACAPAMREFDKPKFIEGDLVWLTEGFWPSTFPLGGSINDMIRAGTMAMVVGAPEACGGTVGYPLLIGARPVVVSTGLLTRNPSKVRTA